MIRLETDRLIIRDHSMEDIEGYHILMSDIDTLKYLIDLGTSNREESLESLQDAINQASDNNRERYFFGMFLKESGEYLGEIGFTILQRSPLGDKAELGYFIGKEFWGRGYTCEAAAAVLAYAFDTLGLYKMITGCIAENSGSENIMKKLGFTKEAYFKNHVYILDKWMDRVEYGMLNPNK